MRLFSCFLHGLIWVQNEEMDTKSGSSSWADLHATGIRPHLPWKQFWIEQCSSHSPWSLLIFLQSDTERTEATFWTSLTSLPWASLAQIPPILFQMKKATEMPRSAALKISSCTLEKLKVWKESFRKKCKLGGQTVSSGEPSPFSNARFW